MIRMVVGFSTSVWVIRYLGPSDFGKLSYAISLVSVLGIVATNGCNNIAVRELTREETEPGEILGSTLVIQLVGGLLGFGCLITFLLTSNISAELSLLALLIGFSLFLKPLDLPKLWFQAQIDSKYPSIIRTVSGLAMASGRVVLILSGASLWYFGLLELVPGIIVTFGLWVTLYHFSSFRYKLSVSVRTIKGILADGWPLLVAGVAVLAFQRIDKIMLQWLSGSTEVGIYSAAARLSSFWFFLPTVIARSVFPVVVETEELGNEKLYDERMQFLYDGMTLVMYTVAIPTLFVASPLIDLLFQASYSPAAAILQVHILSLVFIGMADARARWLFAENYTGFHLKAALAGGVVNIVFNYFLIPIWGGYGAAWATLTTYIVYGYLSSAFSTVARHSFVQMTKALVVPFRLGEVLELSGVMRGNKLEQRDD
jgi:PST family polysaccharide transporter